MVEGRPFDPGAILRVLAQHKVQYVLIGGLAASLHGSPYATTDVDITPSPERTNLARLASALYALESAIRVEGVPEGLPFDCSAATLARASILNLTTCHGNLDLAFTPAGTRGFEDLKRDAVEIAIHDTPVVVATLADVIRSKEAADRAKDRLVLPTLRRLLERIADPD